MDALAEAVAHVSIADPVIAALIAATWQALRAHDKRTRDVAAALGELTEEVAKNGVLAVEAVRRVERIENLHMRRET